MAKKFSPRKYEAAMDIDERTASKRQLRRKIKALYQLADDYSDIEEKDAVELAAAHEAIGDLICHLMEYAEDLDKADADIDAVIETAAEETRNYSKALRKANQRIKELEGYRLDQMSLDEIIKPGVPSDLIDGRTITEWHEAAERLEGLNEFNRKRANKYEVQAQYWKQFADLCDTEKMTMEEIAAKEGRLKELRERMKADDPVPLSDMGEIGSWK